MSDLQPVIVYDKFAMMKNYRRHDGEYGVEIETESKVEYNYPKMSFWEVHQDGSLRNFGAEYVLKVPLKFDGTLEQALKEFKDKTKDIKFIEKSITTSVHVHMNILNESFITLGNVLTIYAMLENLLLHYSGQSRTSNLFCLAISDAEETFNIIKDILGGFERKNYAIVANYTKENSKYSAVNMSSLYNYGSLEFRSFRGTSDIEVIKQWIGIIHSILVFSRQDLNPHNIIEQWKNRGFDFLKEIFGEYWHLLEHKDQVELVDRNFWYAASIAYHIKDWNVFKEAHGKKLSPEVLEKLAAKYFGKTSDALTPAQYQKLMINAPQWMKETANEEEKARLADVRIPVAPGPWGMPAGQVLNDQIFVRNQAAQVEADIWAAPPAGPVAAVDIWAEQQAAQDALEAVLGNNVDFRHDDDLEDEDDDDDHDHDLD